MILNLKNNKNETLKLYFTPDLLSVALKKAILEVNCNQEIFHYFYSSSKEDLETKEILAINNNCPIEILIRLSLDKSEKKIRKLVAKHNKSPKFLLNKLSYHKCEEVKTAVRLNPNCEKETLKRLESELIKEKPRYCKLPSTFEHFKRAFYAF